MDKIRKKFAINISFIALLILICVVAIFVKYPSYYDYWFSSGNGNHFQWVGISVFLAAAGLAANSYFERKKYKIEIVSKSRLNWMETVRDLISVYTATSVGLIAGMKDVVDSQMSEEIYGDIEHLDDLIVQHNKSYYSLKLYIPHDGIKGNAEYELNERIETLKVRMSTFYNSLIKRELPIFLLNDMKVIEWLITTEKIRYDRGLEHVGLIDFLEVLPNNFARDEFPNSDGNVPCDYEDSIRAISKNGEISLDDFDRMLLKMNPQIENLNLNDFNSESLTFKDIDDFDTNFGKAAVVFQAVYVRRLVLKSREYFKNEWERLKEY